MVSLPDTVAREILLSFWKVHILHHAGEGPIYGHWITDELRRHGYNISPGTLYPLLRRMESHGWLKCNQPANAAANARKEYRLTQKGAKILALIRTQVVELHREVIAEAKGHRRRGTSGSRRSGDIVLELASVGSRHKKLISTR